MTSQEMIAASYAAERNYSHNLDDVIDASDAVFAIGTEKVDTTTLKDRSPENNNATIHSPMPTEGFIQGRRFDGNDDNITVTNSSSININTNQTILFMCNPSNIDNNAVGLINKHYASGFLISMNLGGLLIYVHSGTTTISKSNFFNVGTSVLVTVVLDNNTAYLYENGVYVTSGTYTSPTSNTNDLKIGKYTKYFPGVINVVEIFNEALSLTEVISKFNIIARLPFWAVNYEDYPDNVTEYTDNLPYSSSIISSGTFKVDDDKLQCVSAGTMTYSASYEFDGSEYIKVEIGGVEYAGTGTITQGNTTVSVAQGSNKVTIVMGTGDTIDDEIYIQFREEV